MLDKVFSLPPFFPFFSIFSFLSLFDSLGEVFLKLSYEEIDFGWQIEGWRAFQVVGRAYFKAEISRKPVIMKRTT